MVYNLIPNLCLLCRCFSDGGLLCRDCDAVLPRLGRACRHCALPLQHGDVCGRCLRKPPPVTVSVAPLRYESWTRGLMHRFKFGGDLRIGCLLADYLCEKVRVTYRAQALPQAILPVPLHASRLRERGFNQAVELAKPIARVLQRPVLWDAATRCHATHDQIGLSALARRRNVRHVFAIHETMPAHIAIIDDVVTTGATILALAQQARRAGATQIDVWCVARTVGNFQ